MANSSSSHRFAGGHAVGVLLITASVFLLSFCDALVKLTGASFGLAQLIFLRSFGAAILLMVGMMLFARKSGLLPRRPLWVTARSLCLVSMWFFYYASLPQLPLSLAAACYYTAPLWMALLARLLLGNAVGLRRWIAIMIALVGVVMSVNPAADHVSGWVLLPLLAAFFYALAAIITWSKCRDEAPFVMALNLNLSLAVAGAIVVVVLFVLRGGAEGGFVFTAWRPLAGADWAMIALLSLFLVAITSGVAGAYRAAPAPVVGLFDNAYLVFATFWSVVIFSEIPSIFECFGLVLIGIGAAMASWGGREE